MFTGLFELFVFVLDLVLQGEHVELFILDLSFETLFFECKFVLGHLLKLNYFNR